MNLEKEFKLLGKIRSSKERKAKILELFRSIAQGLITSKKRRGYHPCKKK